MLIAILVLMILSCCPVNIESQVRREKHYFVSIFSIIATVLFIVYMTSL